MRRGTMIALLALVCGIAIGVPGIERDAANGSADLVPDTLRDTAAATRAARQRGDPDNAEQTALIIESLAQILDDEISERRVLEERLDDVHAELRQLRRILDLEADEQAASEQVLAARQRARVRNTSSADERLLAAGFSLGQVESLRRLEAAEQMTWIELDDRARREGWINTPRYFDEMNAIGSAGGPVRRELGDDRYDQYLFASGRPNRIAVGSVIPTSPGEKAGLLPGDIISRYGGEKVFSSMQLTQLRSGGDSGMPVTIEVIRDGQVLQITLPRGPIGIQTSSRTVDPSSTGGR